MKFANRETVSTVMAGRYNSTNALLKEFEFGTTETSRGSAYVPTAHSYWGGVLGQANCDPLLVFELAHQMLMCHLQKLSRRGDEVRTIVARTEIHACPLNPGLPVDLRFQLLPESEDKKSGRRGRERMRVDLYQEGRPCGSFGGSLSFVATEELARMRRSVIDSRPLTGEGTASEGSHVHEAVLGAGDHDLLTGIARDTAGDTVRATLDPPGRGHTLSDPPVDHVPAMVLLHAVQQLARIQHGMPMDFEHSRIALHRFCELDAPCEVFAWPSTDAGHDGRIRTEVRAEQAGLLVMDGTLTAQRAS